MNTFNSLPRKLLIQSGLIKDIIDYKRTLQTRSCPLNYLQKVENLIEVEVTSHGQEEKCARNGGSNGVTGVVFGTSISKIHGLL